MKLLLATQNPNKVIELKRLSHNQLDVISLKDLNIVEDVEETGTSFEENARLKALWAYHLTGLPCIADDSGLEITALNNEPGVYSARYLGVDTPYTIKNQIILDRMQNQSDRSARFISVVCLVLGENDIHCFEGVMEGSIDIEAKGSNGFGYDPIFLPENHRLTYAEMDLNTKNTLSHRGQAFRKVIAYLESRAEYEK
jgi:XTP/dITP diphosphohydrolase